METVVLAQGGLQNVKEMMNRLKRGGVQAHVLPPADGCVTG